MVPVNLPVVKFFCGRVSDGKILIKNLFSGFLRSLGRDAVNDPTIMIPIQNMIQNAVFSAGRDCVNDQTIMGPIENRAQKVLFKAVLGAISGFSLAVGISYLVYKQVMKKFSPSPPKKLNNQRYLKKWKLKLKDGEFTEVEVIEREIEIDEDGFVAGSSALTREERVG